jgi:hypothetical protein
MVITLDAADFTGSPTFAPEFIPLTCSICTNGLIQLKDYIFYYIFLSNIKRIRPELSGLDA